MGTSCSHNDNNVLIDLGKEWSIEHNTIQRALTTAKKEGFRFSSLLTTDEKCVLFLYAKVMHEKAGRKQCIKALMKEKSKPYERLKRVIEEGEMSKNVQDWFGSFCAQHPEWSNSETSFVVFRDHPKLKNKHSYVERVQKSSLCYIHGPIVLQHYLLSMERNDLVGMVNMVEYLKKHLDPQSLKAHIFEDLGGNSILFLRKIMALSDNSSFEVCMSNVDVMLDKWGPALVSGFGVYGNFYDGKTTTFSEKPQGDFVGTHSLVLVGYRKSLDGNLRLILQNWWQEKPFVEMDLGYLKACGGIITFSTQPHFNIPTQFEINSSRHVEAAHDCCEMCQDAF